MVTASFFTGCIHLRIFPILRKANYVKKLNTILAFIIMVAAMPAILLTIKSRLPDVYQDTYYAELPELYQRLENTTGNRIIIIGGSNIAFGIDTELLENLLDEMGYNYTVCPFGLYGAIGSSAMLDLAESQIRKGDIVILSFEPSSDAMSEYFGATAYLKAVESDPLLLTKLNKDRFDAAMGNTILYLQDKYALVHSDTPIKLDTVYQKAAFNENCNMIYPREYNIMTLGYDPTATVDFSGLEISDVFAQQVQSFCQNAEKKETKVYYSFCPMNISSIETSIPLEEELKVLYNKCSEAFKCRIISNPERYVMDSEWFYDSNVHLNTAGSKLRTKYLAEDLLAEMGCYKELAYQEPSKPVTPVQTSVYQDEDLELYTFISDNEGKSYYISNVTEKGMKETALTVPASYNGLPVVGFTTEAFSKCTNLAELRLPSSVISIPDNAFTGCASLSRLILEHTQTPCKITEQSLNGCSKLKILVPKQSYSMYRDGQGCDTNLWDSYLSQIYTY